MQKSARAEQKTNWAMANKSTNILLLLLFIAIGVIFFYPCSKPITKKTIITRDSIVRDTIRDTIPIPYPIVGKEKRDTLWQKDTIYIPIYFTQMEYKTKDYKVVIEGYCPKLVSIETYPVTHFITKEVTIEKELSPPRITHGLNIGTGLFYGTKGIDVGLYIGYGLTINLNKKGVR